MRPCTYETIADGSTRLCEVVAMAVGEDLGLAEDLARRIARALVYGRHVKIDGATVEARNLDPGEATPRRGARVSFTF